MDLTQENLSPSSISVFVTGFVTEEVQSVNMFKSFKIIVTEFTGKGPAGNKFPIRCRYLRTDERIDKKATKTRRHSSLMVTGELILIGSEFQIDIQDINFLPMSMANIETQMINERSAGTSLYSWSTSVPLGRLSAQAMADTISADNVQETDTNDEIVNEEADADDDEDVTNASDDGDNITPQVGRGSKRGVANISNDHNTASRGGRGHKRGRKRK